MPVTTEYDPQHPHEPDIPPCIAEDGHCRICRLTAEHRAEVERLMAYADGETDKLRAALRELDEARFDAEVPIRELREAVNKALDSLDRLSGHRCQEQDVFLAHIDSIRRTLTRAMPDALALVERENLHDPGGCRDIDGRWRDA